MTETSKEKLARALEEAGDPKLAKMIERARDGFYSDYESPLALPELTLVRDLAAAGHPDLARRAQAGEFDGTKEEADAWAASEEGQAAFRELINGGG